MIEHKKEFGIYHWDTFDNETFLVDEADTLQEAQDKVQEKYKGRIRSTGADRVDIVDKRGNVVDKYSVG
jgi:hypothetical protein